MRAIGAIGRLTERRDFLATASGRRFHCERMTLQGRLRTLPDGVEPAGQGLRVGLTVTKRVGHATERNRIKRRLRAALREAGAGEATIPADVVVVARRGVLGAEYRLLVEELQRGLRAVTKPKVVTTPKPPRPDPSNLPAQGRRRGTPHA